jgi:hypothetical protein
MTDVIDELLGRIVTKVAGSGLSDNEKADVFARISSGLHHLVWPILLVHMPEQQLKEFIDHPENMTIDHYTALIEAALQNPQTPKEVYTEILGALEEVEGVVDGYFPANTSQTV